MMERFCMLVLSCLLLAHKSESKSCQIGWTTFSDDGLCYKFSPDLETFDQAVATCSGSNASLTAVKTNTQQDFLVSIIPQDVTVRQFWIGLGKNDTGLFWLVDGTAYDDSAVSYGSVPFDARCWFTIDRIDNTWKRKRCDREYGFPAFCVKQPTCSISSQEADCPTTTTPPTTTPQPTTTTPTTPRPTTRPKPTTAIRPSTTTTTTTTTTTAQLTKTTSTAPIATATTITRLTPTADQSSTIIQTQPSTTRERTTQQTVKSTKTTTMIQSMPTNQGATNTKSTLTSVMVPTTTPLSSDNATSIETSTAPTSVKTTTLSYGETSSDLLQLNNATNTYQATTVKDLLIETKEQTGSQSNVAGAAAGSILGVLMLAGVIGLVVVVVRYKKKKRAIAEDEKA